MKRLFVFVAFVMTVLCANAQVENGFRLGAVAGVNMSSLTGENSIDSGTGYFVGLKGEYNLSEKLYMGANLEFSIRRTKWNAIDNGDIDLGYVQIPVYAGYRHPVSDKVTVYGEVGPYFAYGLISTKIEWYSNGSQSTIFGLDDTNRMDVGAAINIGVEFSNIKVFAGYEKGFMNLVDNKSTKNSAVRIGVGYNF